jgi:hypothetical protein
VSAALRVASGAAAMSLALLSLTVGFGGIDLLSPWILHEGTQVTDVGYGTLAGIVLPMGLLAAARRSPAGLHQVLVAAAAYAAAGLLAGAPRVAWMGALVAGAAFALAVLHPRRRALVPLRRRPSLPLLVLALAACAPGSQYALHMAFNQRNGVLPADAHLGLGCWAALSAAALAALFVALVAAFRTSESVVPGLCSAVAVLVWAATCLAYPHSAGALGPVWATLAVVWALAFGTTVVREHRKGPAEAGPSLSDTASQICSQTT